MEPDVKVVISEFMDLPAVEALKGRFDTVYDPQLVDDRPGLASLLSDADALVVRNRTQVDAALVAGAPQLKVVGRLGVGLDNIDVAACRSRGIEVIPATGANALAVAEYVVCTAMLLLRGAYLSTAAVAAGEWPRPRLSEGREAAGRTLGIVGFGNIGQLVAGLAQRLGMRVIAADALLSAADPVWSQTGAGCRTLDEVMAESDAVTLHVPLTDQTRNLVNAERLSRMKRGAVLINTARGGVVDEAALAQALAAGQLAGAALDVFEREPLAAGSPLTGAPNLVLTPHIAGVTQDSNQRVSTMIAERVAAFLAARPS